MPSVLDGQPPITQVSSRATGEDVCGCKLKGRGAADMKVISRSSGVTLISSSTGAVTVQ